MVYVVVGGLVFGGPDGLVVGGLVHVWWPRCYSCWWLGIRWPR